MGCATWFYLGEKRIFYDVRLNRSCQMRITLWVLEMEDMLIQNRSGAWEKIKARPRLVTRKIRMSNLVHQV